MNYLKIVQLASDLALLSKEERKVFAEILLGLKDRSIADDLQFNINVAIQENLLKNEKEFI